MQNADGVDHADGGDDDQQKRNQARAIGVLIGHVRPRRGYRMRAIEPRAVAPAFHVILWDIGVNALQTARPANRINTIARCLKDHSRLQQSDRLPIFKRWPGCSMHTPPRSESISAIRISTRNWRRCPANTRHRMVSCCSRAIAMERRWDASA